MNTVFYNKVANSNARRNIRDELAGMVLTNKKLLPELIRISFDNSNDNYHKACWIAELVFENHIEWLQEHLKTFCDKLSLLENESALRPISKICMMAVKHSAKDDAFLTVKQQQLITEVCFDWLIHPDRKVATKAYAIRTLYLLGKKNDWIYPQLQPILELDFPNQTPAYRAAAKDTLRKIVRYHKK